MSKSSTMDAATQQQFMYLFERISEPIYFGPRGHGDKQVLYNVPLDDLPNNVARSVVDLRKAIPAGQCKTIYVAYSGTYDLTPVRLCPVDAVFSLFVPLHQQASAALVKIFLAQATLSDFFSAVCHCRDRVNGLLWVYSVSVAILARKDMKGFKIPAVHEIFPDRFLNAAVLREARRQARLFEKDRSIIEVAQDFTGLDLNPDNKVAYWRQDIGLNSHHWHWHIVYPLDSPKGQRDRKGELFYHMHHNMVARYDAERLSNGLSRVIPLNILTSVDEGYFSKLTLANAGQNWGGRQPNTTIVSANRVADPNTGFVIQQNDMKVYADRILEAIDQGIIITSAGQTISILNDQGINLLGDLVEASDLNVNPQFYGSLHNIGHAILAVLSDPDYRYKENPGVMIQTQTAVRDPVFFRWHKYIDNIFSRHKQTMTPYTQDSLVWTGVVVTDVGVITRDRTPNTMITYWEQRDVDLSRGLDFGRTSFNGLGPIWARFTHLQHEPFTYRIQVSNNGRAQIQATVRIFMAPRLDEHSARLGYVEQRLLFFEMDKFTVALRPGANTIERRSDESTVTIPWEQNFNEIERSISSPTAFDAICGCGWPAHLLLPKGKPEGLPFDLFVMVTNFEQDRVRRVNPVSEANAQGCRDSAAYCGILDELYPDSKPMGYPFDRPPAPNASGSAPTTLDDYIVPNSNMKSVQVDIIHRNTTVVVSETAGAPAGLPIIPQGLGRWPNSKPGEQFWKTSGDVLPSTRTADERQHSPMDHRSQESPVGWEHLGPSTHNQAQGTRVYSRGKAAGGPRDNPERPTPQYIAPRL